MSDDWAGDPDEFEFDEQLEDQWLAEWDAADRDAVEVLREALAEHRGQRPPADDLKAGAAAVRARRGEDGDPLAWVWQAAGADVDAGADDAQLLVRLAAATISPQQETGLDVEEESLLLTLEHADWLGAIITAVRGAPGADASPSALVDGVRNCPEVELESELDIDDESHLDAAFWIVALPWEMLGLTDRDQRLTELGQWVLPRALARAWSGDFDAATPGSPD